MFGFSPHSLDSSCLFPGMQVALVFMAFAVGSKAFCLVRTTNVLDQMNLGLGFLPSFYLSDRLTSLQTSGSSFIFTDCESFLIIITTGLLFLGGMLLSAYELAIADVVNTELAKVSGCSSSIGVLMNLCAAGTSPGFGGSIHSFHFLLSRAYC